MNNQAPFPPRFPISALHLFTTAFCLVFLLACREKDNPPLPAEYRQGGAFIKTLPYFNPDSCVLLIRRDVPQRWQGAAYENLFLDGPEDSSPELGLRHLDSYKKNFPSDTSMPFIQYWRGRVFSLLGKMDSARILIHDAYEWGIRTGQNQDANDAQNFLAAIYYKEGKTAEAIRAYHLIYDGVKNLDSAQNHQKYWAASQLAAAYHQSGNLQEALAWAHRCQPFVADEKSNLVNKIDLYERYYVVYGALKMFDSALISAKYALELSEKYEPGKRPVRLLDRVGSAYFKIGDCPNAMRYAHEIQQKLPPTAPPTYLANMYFLLGDAYSCLGKTDSAVLCLQQSLISPNPLQKATAQTLLGNLYAQKGNYKAAYDAQKASLKTRNELYTPEKMQEMGAAKIRIELERAQLLIEKLDQQHTNERLQQTILALSLILGIGFLLSLFLRQRGRQRILKQEKQLLETNQTLLAQQNQLLEKDKTLLTQEKQLAEAREILKTQALERAETSLKTTKDELDTTTRLLELKNQLIEELEMRLHDQFAAPSDNLEGALPRAAAGSEDLHRMKILTESDWGKFRERFEASFPGFMLRLKSQFPSLTAAETRLFLLIKLKFSNQEMSETLGISIESIYRSRHRLSKKIGLVDTGDLDIFVAKFG